MSTATDLTPSQRAVLSTVLSFSQAERYLGLMPRHVVISLKDEDIAQLEAHGLVVWDQAGNSLGATVQGLRLTPQGHAAINGGAHGAAA